jgi:allantoinase
MPAPRPAGRLSHRDRAQLIDCFDVMYEEGAEHPKPMSLALHDRLTGPHLQVRQVLDHITARDRIWICTGRQIAEHWRRVHAG